MFAVMPNGMHLCHIACNVLSCHAQAALGQLIKNSLALTFIVQSGSCANREDYNLLNFICMQYINIQALIALSYSSFIEEMQNGAECPFNSLENNATACIACYIFVPKMH